MFQMDRIDSFCTEYARTSRGKCRECVQIINKGEVRIGVIVYAGPRKIEQWYHVNCFFTKRARELHTSGILGDETVIKGIDAIDPISSNTIHRKLISTCR